MHPTPLDHVYYALAKQVPAMRTQVTLDTNYGGFTLYGKDAARVAAVVERILRKRQQRLQALAEQAAK
jgi:hypothetical protein